MFYDPADFPFLEPLRASWRDIRAEYMALDVSAKPWFGSGTAHNGGWHAIVLKVYDKWYLDPALVPVTARLCEAVPGVHTFFFSLMLPGAHIDWHIDTYTNCIRAHLGLICPEDAVLEVGSEARSFHEGEFVLFDDTVRHRAWNRGDKIRANLLIGFEHDRTKGIVPDIPEKFKASMDNWTAGIAR